MEVDINKGLSERLKLARSGRGWTLEQFAAASGVSRAMISKIERGEVSPTASILARLAAGLGTSLASLFTAQEAAQSPLCRWDEQRDWTDPASGYVRRNVSPAGSVAEIVYVTFPPGARVVFDNHPGSGAIEQQVWILEGAMEMSVGAERTELSVGDCLRMTLNEPIVFHNPGTEPARYMVVLARRPA